MGRKKLYGATLAAIALCAINLWVMARAETFNSDELQIFNQIFSVLPGNLRLRNWYLTTDNFNFSDLPWMIGLAQLFGVKLWLIYTQPALVFGSLLLAAVLLVLRERPQPAEWRGIAVLIFLIGLPFAPELRALRASATHTGTIALCLWALLCVQPVLADRRMSRWFFLGFFLLAFCAIASDPFAQVFFTLPLLALIPLRLWLYRRFRPDDWGVFISLLGAAALGHSWPGFVAAHQGYTSLPAFTMAFVPDLSSLAYDGHAVASGVRVLFTAQPASLGGFVLHGWLAATRLAAMLAAGALCLFIIWRAPLEPAQGLAQLMVLSATVCAIACLPAGSFAAAIGQGIGFPQSAVRYLIPTYLLSSVAAALAAQRLWPLAGRPLRIVAGLAVSLSASLFVVADLDSIERAVRTPPGIVSSPAYALAQTLQARHLTYGVSDYWTAAPLTAFSLHRVIVDPVSLADTLRPFLWLTDGTNFQAHRRPQFAIYTVGNGFGVSPASIARTYGQPRETFSMDGFQVFVLPP